MGYVEGNLIQDENIMYRAPLHWRVMVGPALMSLLLLAVAFFVFQQAWSDSEAGNGFLIAGGILVALSAIPIIKGWITVRSSEFVVTNKRVILKTGFIHNKTAEMFLSKIESVGVDQTIFGRIIGYGSIELRGTGGSLEPFSNISRPLEFRRQIQEQIGRALEERGTKGQGAG